MKICVASDMHLEHYHPAQKEAVLGTFIDRVQSISPKVLVLAGDIAVWADKLTQENDLTFGRLAKEVDCPIIYVMGNHEFYGSFYEKAEDRAFETVTRYGITLLTPHTPVAEVDGQRFVGSTLWYPRPIFPISTITDHQSIRNFHRVYEAYGQFMDSVIPIIQKDDILVTHHMSSGESINPKFQGSELNHWFCTDISKHLTMGIKAAIHGHGHDPVDCISGYGFPVYSNPMGYPGEGTNPDFLDRLEVNL